MANIDNIPEAKKWVKKGDVIKILTELIQFNKDCKEQNDCIELSDYYWGAYEALDEAFETVKNLGGKTPNDILLMYGEGGVCSNAGMCALYTKPEINKKRKGEQK